MKKIFIITALSVLMAAGAYARDKLEASLEMTRVYIGNPVYLYLTFTGSSSIARPDVPELDGLRINPVGSSTEMTVIRGDVSRSVTYSYLIMPLEGGDYDIGPFSAVHDGRVYEADAVRLTVERAPPGSAVGGAPAAAPRAPAPASPAPRPPVRADSAAYAGNDVFLVMEVARRKVYVNEEVPVTIKLYVDGVGLRDIEYPVYSHEGFSSEEFLQPERKRESYRGAIYDTLEFRQRLFAIKEGDHILGPARMNCNMVTRKSAPSRRSSIFGVSVFIDQPFTSGFETYPIMLESESVPVTVLPFPEDGRPPDFKGAVGNFSFDAVVRPGEVKVGDPVTVTMTIGGHGNLDTVTVDGLRDSDAFKAYEPRISRKDGKKIYEQVLIPRNREADEIPPVSFSYFDPAREKYETITRGPFPLKVAEQPLSQQAVRMVTMPLGEHVFYPPEELGQDILHIKDRMGELTRKGDVVVGRRSFWGIQIIPVAVFGLFYFYHRKKRRIMTDRGYARSVKAPGRARAALSTARRFLKKKDIPGFYDIVFKAMSEYLGNKLDLPKGNIDAREIEDRLSRSRCDDRTIKMVREVFSRCEMARYASSVSEGWDHERVLRDFREIIDRIEKARI